MRELASGRMHRAKTSTNTHHLGMTAKSEAIARQQVEGWKSQLSTAGATTCRSNRHRDQQSAPDLALAKSVRMTQGIALSAWRRRLKKMKKEKLAQRVSVIAFGRRNSPKALHCQEILPSTMARCSLKTGCPITCTQC